MADPNKKHIFEVIVMYNHHHDHRDSHVSGYICATHDEAISYIAARKNLSRSSAIEVCEQQIFRMKELLIELKEKLFQNIGLAPLILDTWTRNLENGEIGELDERLVFNQIQRYRDHVVSIKSYESTLSALKAGRLASYVKHMFVNDYSIKRVNTLDIDVIEL